MVVWSEILHDSLFITSDYFLQYLIYFLKKNVVTYSLLHSDNKPDRQAGVIAQISVPIM